MSTYIQQNSFPAASKIARVSPLPRNELPKEADHYRPISVLPVLSKVYERLVLTQLLEYIQQYNVLKDTVLYRLSEGTFNKISTILLRIRDDIIRAMKKREVTLIAFADFSKAFDTVSYRTIIKRLHSTGFSHGALTWIFNYLRGESNLYKLMTNNLVFLMFILVYQKALF